MSEVVLIASLLAALLALWKGFPGCGFSGQVGTEPTPTDLMFYDRDRGEGEFYALDGEGGMGRIAEADSSWRESWALIVPGRFDLSSRYTDLLFYDRRAGEGEFWATYGDGSIGRITETDSSWRESWALIVPGRFDLSSRHTDLLFYDRRAGQGEFWALDGQGGMVRITETISGWRTSWSLIVPGHFDVSSRHTDLLFYDRDAGLGDFWALDGQGGMVRITETISGWRRSWSLIVPGNFADGEHTDLLFYDADAGQGEFWALDGQGGMVRIGETHTSWRTSWSLIVPGRFDLTSGYTDLLFYDPDTGQGEFWATYGDGSIALIGETHTDWRTSWARITPGQFG